MLASTADELKLNIEKYLEDILACCNVLALHHQLSFFFAAAAAIIFSNL